MKLMWIQKTTFIQFNSRTIPIEQVWIVTKHWETGHLSDGDGLVQQVQASICTFLEI